VNSTDDFTDQPAVMNGCSELFVEVFGEENGIGVRSALGANVLPGNIPVEIEGVVEVD
jgi:enamine deaminase RidA (YjgF/YER057c/UK114 family)